MRQPPRNYALLIGVSDYAVYDETAGLPPGTSDLPGARNDVQTWLHVCRQMGFSPDRIRVLTAKPLSREELGPDGEGVALGDATHASIVDGIAWLMRSIAGDEPCAGLLTFSGHGILDPGTTLCPSDTTADFANVIHVEELLRQIHGTAASERLTMLLDSCHAAVRQGSLAVRLLQRVADAAHVPSPWRLEERVIAASKRGQVSGYGVFQGRYQGAFTWALTSALGQWSAVDHDGVLYVDISYGDLVARTNTLTAALDYPQDAMLSGPSGVSKLAFLQPGSAPLPTSEVPTQTRYHGQLVPDKYLLQALTSSGTWVDLAFIDVTTSLEVWNVDQSSLANLASYGQIALKQVSSVQSINNVIVQTTPTTVAWSPETDPRYPASGKTFSGSYTYSSGGANGPLALNLQTTPTTAGARLVSTTWFNPDLSGNNIGLANQPNATVTMPAVTSASYSGTCNVASSTMTNA